MILTLQFIGGLLTLIGGAELLVKGSTRMAGGFGIPSLLVGLTVVAVGTSSPEIAVSLKATLSGETDLTVGNIVGSNIANILLILGVAAIASPLEVKRRIVRQDAPILLGISVLVYLLAFDGYLSYIEGSLLLILQVGYLVYVIKGARRAKDGLEESPSPVRADPRPAYTKGAVFIDLALALGGLGLLVLGSGWLVDSASTLARMFGVSELIIGLTLVAVGTSLPELATSIMAGLRGETDLAVGSAVGSNIFNLLLVLGLTAFLAPAAVHIAPSALAFDFPVMLAAAAAALPIFFTGYKVARWEGYLFLGYYLAYCLYLYLDAAGHDLLPLFSRTMLWFVLPLTLITLAVILWRERRIRASA